MTLTPVIDSSALDGFCADIYDATDLTSGSAFAVGVDGAADAYFDAMRERYDQFSDRGGDWAEHAPSTQKRRGVGAPILIERGDLRESMDRGDSLHVQDVQSDCLIEGTADPIAEFHQHGTDKMPAREIVVEPDEGTLQSMKMQAVAGLQQSVREILA